MSPRYRRRRDSLRDGRSATSSGIGPAWKERAYRKASWRLALKVAARTSTRALGRSALIVAMVALPVTGLVGISVVADSMYSPSIQQRLDTELGHMKAMIQVATPPGSGMVQDPLHPEWYEASNWNERALAMPDDVLPAGTKILSITSASVTAKTATGLGQITVQEGQSWDPSFAPRYEITQGRSPRSDREVMVTAALLPRLGAKVGDSVELLGAADVNGNTVSSVTIVGVLKDNTLPDSGQQFYATTGALSSGISEANLQSAKFYLPDTTVSWNEVQNFNAEGLTVLSRAVLLDPPPNDGTHPVSNQWTYILAVGSLFAIIAGFAAFEVILLAGAAFTVTARQQQRTLATIASVGAPRKLLFRILAANGIVLGAIGGLVGVGLGLGAAALFMALTADGSATQYYGFHLPWLGFLIAVAFAVLIGWLASLVPARTTSRFDIVSALRGARKPPTATAKRPIVGLVVLIVGVALTLIGGVLLAILTEAGRTMPGGQHPLVWAPIVMLVVGPILAQLGLILIGPLLLRGIAKLLGRSGLGARLAARDSARNPGRAVPALAAVMTTVFVAVFGMCFIAGSEATSRDNYQWAMPLGNISASLIQVDYENGESYTVRTYDHPGALEDAIRNSVDIDQMERLATVPEWNPQTKPSTPTEVNGVAIPVIPPQNLCPMDPQSPDFSAASNDLGTDEGRQAQQDWRCQDYYPQSWGPGFSHLFVSDAKGLTLALGHQPSVDAIRTLRAGGAVSLYRQYVDNGKFSISWWTPQQADQLHSAVGAGTPLRTETLSAVVELPEHPIHFGVFITKATADRLGLEFQNSMVLASTKTMPTTQQQDALNKAMSVLPDNNKNGSLVYANVENGPPDFAGPVVWGLLGLAGLIALASSAIAIGLARFDGRQDDATLSALGAGRVVRRSFAFWQAIIIAGIGSVLGAATGLVPAWALGATGLPFVPPWIPIGIAVIALPLVIACGSWLLATRSKVSARRVAIA